MNLGGYQPDLQVDRRMLEQTLRRVESHKLFLLGLIRDRQGKWEVFTHNRHAVVPTQSFGTCYLAGTGTSLLAVKINERDRHAQASKKAAFTQRVSITENLAEGLSSDMLYAESDHLHGLDGMVSTYSCGGFYEWYRLVQEGVRKMPSRLDIHVTKTGDDVVITRLYLIASLQRLESKLDPIPTQKYAIQILSVVSEPTTPSQQTDGSWSLSTDNVDAVLIESTFELYDTPEKGGRISGPVPKDFLEKFFMESVSINRIRMICSSHGSAASRSISRLDVELDVLATASFEGGLLNLSLSEAVATTAAGMLQRLQEQSMPRQTRQPPSCGQ
ncbi:hypothetical protein [Variovorax sp. OV700]|uniref:hypothetical protein n=1 Tax=Variovorax sp. OV700 TaxID=1882826 RepID=UPI001113AC5E|nr:hypothetical protein [Variovorax sp. OV700]